MFALRTLPGQLVSGSADVYYISEKRGVYTLRNHSLAPRTFPSLSALAHTLGGIVPWARWSPDAQLQITQLKIAAHF